MYISSTVGIWPIIFENDPKLKRIYTILAYILYFYYVEYIFRAYFQLILLLRADNVGLNVQEILGNLCITLIYTVTLLRMHAFNTIEIRSLFVNIIESESKYLHDPNEGVRKIYLAGLKINRIYHILFFVNGWFVSMLYFLHPFFMDLPTQTVGNETVVLRALPLSTWWPIDTQKHFWFAYCWNVFDGTLGSSYVINTDMLTFSLVVFAISQLDILSYRVKHFTSSNTDADFIELIKEHQKVISYINRFNNGLKYVMLFDFLQSSLQLATTMLQLYVMRINFTNLVFVFEFFITMMMRLAIYYFNGNEIIYKSEKLAMDISSTSWYEYTKSAKFMMKFFIMRAHKPLMFGPFGVLSLQTFIAILKTSYSYLMVFNSTKK